MSKRWPPAPFPRRNLLLALGAAALVAACSGRVPVGSSSSSGGGGAGSGGATGGVLPPLPPDPNGGAAACKPSPGPSPLRRLSKSEYRSTIADLFGDPRALTVDFVPEARVDNFDNNAQNRAVSDELAQQYFEAAEKLAAAAAGKLSSILSCDPAQQGEPACLDAFLDGFGKRAWRRPLTSAERDNLRMAFTQGRAATFADGIQAVIQVMLLSPQFMYRVEEGVAVAGADYLRLSPYELASRLSYLLWGSMPDAALFAAADAGQLTTREDVKAQARRMLDDPRAAKMVQTFAAQWLRLDEIPQLEKQAAPYPTFKPELRASMQGEQAAFFDAILWKGDGKLDTLLTAPYTYVDQALAAYYGLPGVTGPGFQRVSVDPTQRGGFLTQGGLLSVLGENDGGINSLIYRGLFMRERLLCQPVPDPPPDAPSMNPPVTPTTSGRASSIARQMIPLCGACHGLMDKMGFALETFDGVGLYRTMDHGNPVDPSGELTGTDVDGTFTGIADLTRKLASSKTVHECLATQWFRYGFGRQESAPDACALDTLKRVSLSTGGNFKELLLALTQTDAFLLRSKGDQP